MNESTTFLVACTRLYTPLCPSVGRLVTLYFFYDFISLTSHDAVWGLLSIGEFAILYQKIFDTVSKNFRYCIKNFSILYQKCTFSVSAKTVPFLILFDIQNLRAPVENIWCFLFCFLLQSSFFSSAKKVKRDKKLVNRWESIDWWHIKQGNRERESVSWQHKKDSVHMRHMCWR